MKIKMLMAPEGDTNSAKVEEKKPVTETPPEKKIEEKAPDKKAPNLLADTDTGDKAKDGDKAKADETASSEIKLNVPEGFTVDQKRLEGFVAFAKENKISQEAAQKFFDQYVEQQKADAHTAQQSMAEQITSWAEESKKTFGKDFDAKIADAKRALRALGDDEVAKVLTDSGLGNHKSVIKLLAAAGAKIAEDKLPKSPGSPNTGKKSQDEKMRAMYDKSPEMFDQK